MSGSMLAAGESGRALNSHRAQLVVEAAELEKRYGSRTAVAGISFNVKPGEIFGILGPNGAGKTSTMRMVGCLTDPTRGTLEVLGRNPAVEASEIRRRLGIVSQEDCLDPDLSVRENLSTYGRYFGFRGRAFRREIDEHLELFGLAGHAAGRIQQLSGGMRRCLAIARAFVTRPELLLLDEPTTGLDPEARQAVWARFEIYRRSGRSIVLTTHYMEEAEYLCDRIAVLASGTIVAESSPRALIEEYVTPQVVEVTAGGAANRIATIVSRLSGIDRVEKVSERVLVYSSEPSLVTDALLSTDLSGLTTITRQATLDDVYIRLCGRGILDRM